MRLRRVSIALIVGGLAVADSRMAVGLNEGSHAIVNEHAGRRSTLDVVLKRELGLAGGIDGKIRGSTVLDWLRLGGILEDQGGTLFGVLSGRARSLRHFHDPLRPWDTAGLRLLDGLIRYDSSIRWMQREDQSSRAGGSGNWSWQQARRSYEKALTAGDAAAREQAFADTFRALGQVMHLVVDASVPEHVRDDPHAMGRFYGNYEYWVSAQHGRPGSLAEDGFIQGYLSSPFDVDPAILRQPTGDSQAPVPISRLIDSDTYGGLETGPNVTLGRAIGIGEFANANFFNENPGFDRYPFPDVDRLVPSLHPAPGTGRARRYFAKGEGDGLPVDPVLAECVLSEAARADGVVESRTYGCTDENVWAQTAQVMLPRAVGYARGALDYFFRGRLEVDLLPNPENPSFIGVAATNGSDDELVNGVLTLYRDEDPAPGSRSTVVSGQVEGLVQPGQELFFLLPSFPAAAEDSERRFVAVYKGTLGLEKQEGTFPGGVIGRVVGGVRVEEVFAEGENWKLRTPKGVFALQGLTVAEFEDVRWGDGDSLLVARTPFGLGQPSRFVVYEVEREPGSVEVARVSTPDGVAVPLSVRNEAVFAPEGIDLGTAVSYVSSTESSQQIAEYVHRNVGKTDSRGNCGIDHVEFSPPSARVVTSAGISFSGGFQVRLDLAHEGTFGTASGPYVWFLQEAAATKDARLLGLVVVYLTAPQDDPVSVPTIGLNRETGAEEPTGQTTFFPGFPPGVDILLWALVDLKSGEVVASTATANISLIFQETNLGSPDLYANVVDDCSGTSQWFRTSTLTPVSSDFPIDKLGTVSVGGGITSLSVAGRLKAELDALTFNDLSVFPDFQLGSTFGRGRDLIECAGQPGGGVSCVGIEASASGTVVLKSPAQLQDARRSRPAPGAERLALVSSFGFGSEETVLVWDPGSKSARALFQPAILGESSHRLGAVTGAMALIVALGGGPFDLVPLEGSQAPVFFPFPASSASFTLLNPRYLYHLGDLTFYRPKPPLQATVLPARLAEAPGNPVGDYHVIRLP